MYYIQLFDDSVLNFIQENVRCLFLDTLMPIITTLGEKYSFWVIIGICLLFIPKKRYYGISLLCTLALAAICGELILKNIFCRIRPCNAKPILDMLVACPPEFSFPSGHSMSSFTAAAAIFVIDKRFGIPALVLASIIAFSRLYLYVHYPTDVIVGMLLGLFFGFLIFPQLHRWITEKLGGTNHSCGI